MATRPARPACSTTETKRGWSADDDERWFADSACERLLRGDLGCVAQRS